MPCTTGSVPGEPTDGGTGQLPPGDGDTGGGGSDDPPRDPSAPPAEELPANFEVTELNLRDTINGINADFRVKNTGGQRATRTLRLSATGPSGATEASQDYQVELGSGQSLYRAVTIRITNSTEKQYTVCAEVL